MQSTKQKQGAGYNINAAGYMQGSAIGKEEKVCNS